jgi:hypothetical protein
LAALAVLMATWCMHTTIQSMSAFARARVSSRSSQAFCAPAQ